MINEILMVKICNLRYDNEIKTITPKATVKRNMTASVLAVLIKTIIASSITLGGLAVTSGLEEKSLTKKKV